MKRKVERRKVKRKSWINKQEKQIRFLVFLIFFIILSIFLVNWLAQRTKNFEYAGLKFTEIKQGNLVLYKTTFYLSSVMGDVIAEMPFYFREDPRKLEYIDIEGEIMLDARKPVALAISKEDAESCEDSVLAATTLSIPFFGKLGVETFPASVDKEEAEERNITYVTFNDISRYNIILFKQAEVTKITGKGSLYVLTYKDCEIMNVTERFVLGIYAGATGNGLK